MLEVTRRGFLTFGLAAAASAAAQTNRPRVVILGAGLAGLSAAWELEQLGYDVVILEARTRAGGRVFTMRAPFSDGMYAEVGAARIQDSHEFTLRFVKQFDLALDPFWPASGSNVTLVGGKRLLVPAGQPVDLNQVPLTFTPEELRSGLRPSLAKYLFSHLPALGNPAQRDWPSSDVSRFEVSLPDFLKQQGASDGIVRMVALGHDLSAMSALQLLRDAATGAATKQWYKIRGGNDQLPKAFAAKLARRVVYGAQVVRIEQDDNGVKAIYTRAGTPVTVTGDYMICALPLPVLRRIEVRPAFPPRKRSAIHEVDYLPITRVFLQSHKRFWLERGDTGWASTDDPMDVWDYTRDQPGSRGILGAYTSGRMALRLAYLQPEEQTQLVLQMMERVHPGIRENYEGSASHSWVTDPWSLGAAAEFKAGQLSRHYQPLREIEGRIHFAGEHTSAWNAWMNGALESGSRAVAEIRARR